MKSFQNVSSQLLCAGEIFGLLKYEHFEILLSAQCNEDNYCSFWSFQEHMDTAEKRCFLMQVKLTNTQMTSDENEFQIIKKIMNAITNHKIQTDTRPFVSNLLNAVL